eukprot:4099492-Prymnesium_polylepis.1
MNNDSSCGGSFTLCPTSASGDYGVAYLLDLDDWDFSFTFPETEQHNDVEQPAVCAFGASVAALDNELRRILESDGLLPVDNVRSLADAGAPDTFGSSTENVRMRCEPGRLRVE